MCFESHNFAVPKIGEKPKFGCFLSDGVTGNTSDFGSEESRFEP